MTGPQDPAAAGRDGLRAGHADREQVIETLKTAFVDGRLTSDELDARAGLALDARTYADLAALTADIPPAPFVSAAAGRPRPPTSARRRPLARAAAGSGGCLVIAAAAVWLVGLADPGNTPGPIPKFWGTPCILVALAAVLAALFILGNGVVNASEQRPSRRQLPPRPGAGSHALEGQRRSGTGYDPVPPGLRTDPTGAELQVHKSHQHRRHIAARTGRAPCGVRPAPGTA